VTIRKPVLAALLLALIVAVVPWLPFPPPGHPQATYYDWQFGAFGGLVGAAGGLLAFLPADHATVRKALRVSGVLALVLASWVAAMGQTYMYW
jgi:hypothetical protein